MNGDLQLSEEMSLWGYNDKNLPHYLSKCNTAKQCTVSACVYSKNYSN